MDRRSPATPAFFGRDKVFCDPWHYLPILETKPGALRHGTPFVSWILPPSVETVRKALLDQPKGDRAFADILLGAREAGLEALDVTCQLALEYGKPSAEVILNELRRLVKPIALYTSSENTFKTMIYWKQRSGATN